MTTELGAPEASCPDCRTSAPRGALACPACGALLHRAELSALSAQARAHAERGEGAKESEALRQMLLLLPDEAPQARSLRLRRAQLNGARGAPTGNTASPSDAATASGAASTGAASTGAASTGAAKARRGPLALLALVGLGVWKFKTLGFLLLTKGKLLLMGLTKAKTVFSMLLALGAYWTLWGWPFALGFVLSIYVHEMGHVIALRRLGIPASAPMFIPFVGAFVRLNRHPDTAHDDAIVGLAGPIYGLGAALFCYALYAVTSHSLFGALARSGAWINLFNLIPIWQLDGGRAFNALNRLQRWQMVAVIAGAWLWFQESMLLLLLLGAIYRAFTKPAPAAHDRRAVWTYGLLVAALAAMTHIQLPELASGSGFGP